MCNTFTLKQTKMQIDTKHTNKWIKPGMSQCGILYSAEPPVPRLHPTLWVCWRGAAEGPLFTSSTGKGSRNLITPT